MNTSDNKPDKSFKITGNWNVQSKHLKAKFPELTDEDLLFEHEKDGEVLQRIGARLNKTQEEVISMIKKVYAENY
jgi:hypothetical protein